MQCAYSFIFFPKTTNKMRAPIFQDMSARLLLVAFPSKLLECYFYYYYYYYIFSLCVFTYAPEADHVSRVRSVVAALQLQL
jgi:hypothetical protein